MAETYYKSEIEKLIRKLEIKKQAYQRALSYWDASSIKPYDSNILKQYVTKIELVNEIIADIHKDFDLS